MCLCRFCASTTCAASVGRWAVLTRLDPFYIRFSRVVIIWTSGFQGYPYDLTCLCRSCASTTSAASVGRLMGWMRLDPFYIRFSRVVIIWTSGFQGYPYDLTCLCRSCASTTSAASVGRLMGWMRLDPSPSSCLLTPLAATPPTKRFDPCCSGSTLVP